MTPQKTHVAVVGGLVVVFLVLVAISAYGIPRIAPERLPEPELPLYGGLLSESAARAIAESTCIKGGESLSPGMYNDYTKTWWFDANLNAAQPGCNPACVVSEDTMTAEINWRCTGLIPPPDTDVEDEPGDIEPVACTMDAKRCPDGTYVGRVAPDCAFAPCPTTTAKGTVYGTVLMGPACPVVREGDTSCDDQPYTNATVQFIRSGDAASSPTAVAQTDATGSFIANVPYGTYTVQVVKKSIFPTCEEYTFLIVSEEVLEQGITMYCDTGIR